MKPLIFCIVGESGSGKTMIADYLEELAGIPMIKSWTDRAPRQKDEPGHTFVTREVFDTFQEKNMIAFTTWRGRRYCCFHSDVKDVNTYVIDEKGLQYLKKNFSDRYNVISIRIHRPLIVRQKHVEAERLDRDRGKFVLPDNYYDHVIHNNGQVKFHLLFQIWEIIRQYLHNG